MVLDDFDGIEPIRVLKHWTTRWLSLERAPNRLLLWLALFAYVDCEANHCTFGFSFGSTQRKRTTVTVLTRMHMQDIIIITGL